MKRKKGIEESLTTADAEARNTIKIIRGNEQYEGVLMPHHEFSNEDIITVKLTNGCNIGVANQNRCFLTMRPLKRG